MSKIRKVIDRMKAGEDLGLDRGVDAGRQRLINLDGSYNIERKTNRLFGNFYLFHWLLTAKWRHYWLAVFAFYGSMNVLFATAYYLLGSQYIHGIPAGNEGTKFAYCFFFSAQSFTTVGYGALNPVSGPANVLATLEAFTGLMTFALATGTLWGRFSKPVSMIKYSDKILIAPYKNITGLQFMVANQLNSGLMEVEARVNIRWLDEDEKGEPVRRFNQLSLEIDKIALFPSSWVINHPIDEESVLYGKTLEELKKMDIEVFILIRAFDDVFSQTIYSRMSYLHNQFVYGAKFQKIFYVDNTGKTIIDLSKVGVYDRVEMG